VDGWAWLCWDFPEQRVSFFAAKADHPREDVTKCLVDKDVVLTGVNPTLVPHAKQTKKRAERQEKTA